ncbi:MAG: hypothetical protein SVC26_03780 [Pseudomonadota bacterium]|nr:hypothetical protein [Pseudomonadota bacterium]
MAGPLPLLGEPGHQDRVTALKALASLGLHEHSVLVVGSGFSFHNLRAFFSTPDEKQQRKGQAFDDWLADICLNPQMDEATSRQC